MLELIGGGLVGTFFLVAVGGLGYRAWAERQAARAMGIRGSTGSRRGALRPTRVASNSG